MDMREQKSEALRERLIEMLGNKQFDDLQNLFRVATSSTGRNVLLEDLSDLSRSRNAALRRGLAGRSLAQDYQKWRKSRPLEKIDLKRFLKAIGFPQSRCYSALRLNIKLLNLELQMNPDVLELLVFCHSELWHIKYDELPAMVQKLVSDETLMASAERHKGWFLEAAARYEGMQIAVFQSLNMVSLMAWRQKKSVHATLPLAFHHSDSARMSTGRLHIERKLIGQ